MPATTPPDVSGPLLVMFTMFVPEPVYSVVIVAE